MKYKYMKWYDFKNIHWNHIKDLIIVTDGVNFGYIRPEEIESIKIDESGYVQGIPDSNSHAMLVEDITHYMVLRYPDEY